MTVPYVRTEYDTVVPTKFSKKFIITADEAGIVTKVTKNEITVKYDTKGVKSYKILPWTSKEDSGTCYTHYMATNFKVNQRFLKDDSLVYDSSFMEPDIFNPNRVLLKQGTLVNVALLEDKDTIEDSGSISKKMINTLSTTTTKVKSFVVEANSSILNMCKVGSSVEPSSPLFTIADNTMGDMNELDERTLKILQDFKLNTPKAKVRGKVNKIVIFYNCELEEMSGSLLELTKDSDGNLIQLTGYAGRVSTSYSIAGEPLLPGYVEIKIYIDVNDTMGIADKAILANQLKFTIGSVFENPISCLDGTPVDVTFSFKSISARIVLSPILMGTTSTLMERVKDLAVKTYRELKK